MFNDFDYIQEQSSLMNKKADNKSEMNEDLKMSIMSYAKEVIEGEEKLYDYYTELSNKELKIKMISIHFLLKPRII